MCYATKCGSCGKTTWGGCGRHVDSALRGVPEAQRCTCNNSRSAASSGGDQPSSCISQ